MLVRAPVHGAGVPCTMQQILLFLTPSPQKGLQLLPAAPHRPLALLWSAPGVYGQRGAKLQPSFEARGTINHHLFYTYPASPLGELGNTLVLQNLK